MHQNWMQFLFLLFCFHIQLYSKFKTVPSHHASSIIPAYHQPHMLTTPEHPSLTLPPDLSSSPSLVYQSLCWSTCIWVTSGWFWMWIQCLCWWCIHILHQSCPQVSPTVVILIMTIWKKKIITTVLRKLIFFKFLLKPKCLFWWVRWSHPLWGSFLVILATDFYETNLLN